jgi:hypothetical protein
MPQPPIDHGIGKPIQLRLQLNKLLVGKRLAKYAQAALKLIKRYKMWWNAHAPSVMERAQ